MSPALWKCRGHTVMRGIGCLFGLEKPESINAIKKTIVQ